MNTENSKTNEPHKFRLSLSITHGKTLNQHTTTINLKFLLQPGMILLICLMALILLQTFNIILNLSSKNMKI